MRTIEEILLQICNKSYARFGSSTAYCQSRAKPPVHIADAGARLPNRLGIQIMNNFDKLRFFATISMVALLWSLLGQQSTPITPPPVESTKVVRIDLLSNPSPRLRNNKIEVQAKMEGKVDWWYFSNEKSLRDNLRKGSRLDIWLSSSKDEKHGGEGYIWQIKDIESEAILLNPDRVMFHHFAKNSYGAFIRYSLLLISLITGALAFTAFRRHKAESSAW